MSRAKPAKRLVTARCHSLSQLAPQPFVVPSRVGRSGSDVADEPVVLPKDEYEALAKAKRPKTVDAVAYGRAALARDILAARKAAKLTQAELAKRMNVSQSMVSQAEKNKTAVGERYVVALLKACGLPENWSAQAASQETRDLQEVERALTRAFARSRFRVVSARPWAAGTAAKKAR